MSGQLDMLSTDAPDEEREREYEVDRTPRGLVRAALAVHMQARPCMASASWDDMRCACGHPWRTRPDGCDCIAPERPSSPVAGMHNEVAVAGHRVWSPTDGEPLRVLDVCAGSGVWASEVRRWAEAHGIEVEIDAIEVRPEEREHLERVAQRVHIGDALAMLEVQQDAGPVWHIIVGNPAFSLLAMKTGERSLAPVLLALSRATIMLSTTQAFTRSKAAAEWLHDNPPALEVRIAQGVRFRSTSGTDGISYSVTSWVQHQRHALPGAPWPCQVLVLPAEARSWREIPGREVCRTCGGAGGFDQAGSSWASCRDCHGSGRPWP